MKRLIALMVTAFFVLPVAMVPQDSNKGLPASLLVFFRPKRFSGSGLTPSIYVDGKQVARLDNGRYFALRVSVGPHKIESSMKHPPLEITASSQPVCLEMVILMGTWRGGGRLIPDSCETARQAIARLKPLDAKWIVDSANVTFEIPQDGAPPEKKQE